MGAIEGVPCYFDRLITKIEQNDDGVKVRFKDGSSERYDLVIGADGIHSATRRIVFNEDQKLVSITSDNYPEKAQEGQDLNTHLTQKERYFD